MVAGIAFQFRRVGAAPTSNRLLLKIRNSDVELRLNGYRLRLVPSVNFVPPASRNETPYIPKHHYSNFAVFVMLSKKRQESDLFPDWKV